MIPFRVKLLTPTAKPPHRNCESDLWDLYADGFCVSLIKEEQFILGTEYDESAKIPPQSRILVKTGISLELPTIERKYFFERDARYATGFTYLNSAVEKLYNPLWSFRDFPSKDIEAYAVAEIHSHFELELKHGITVLNSPNIINNSYRKEIGVIIHNTGHEPYTITKGDKICQMLTRPLYPSKMEIVEHIEDTGRGGYGSTGK